MEDVMYDILSICVANKDDAMVATRMHLKAKINWRTANRYRAIGLKCGLLTIDPETNQLQATEKGLAFLKCYRNLGELGGFELL